MAICDYVQGKKHSKKQINISFDEWMVWDHSNEADRKLKNWVKKPHQLEDVYNMEDILLEESMLITLFRYGDRVKMACLAQLVMRLHRFDFGYRRVAADYFYPYMQASTLGKGIVSNMLVKF